MEAVLTVEELAAAIMRAKEEGGEWRDLRLELALRLFQERVSELLGR